MSKLRELLKNATPGEVTYSTHGGSIVTKERQPDFPRKIGNMKSNHDAELYVTLRNAAPEIADLMDALQAEDNEMGLSDKVFFRWKFLDKKLGGG